MARAKKRPRFSGRLRYEPQDLEWTKPKDEEVSGGARDFHGVGVVPGVRLRAVMDNQPGNAEIYSLQLGSRLVVLSLIGTDKEIAASAPVWLAIRRSLKIAASTETAGQGLGSGATSPVL